jgi:hypothetical protein
VNVRGRRWTQVETGVEKTFPKPRHARPPGVPCEKKKPRIATAPPPSCLEVK